MNQIISISNSHPLPPEMPHEVVLLLLFGGKDVNSRETQTSASKCNKNNLRNRKHCLTLINWMFKT